ncbi:MAG: hypothetical protein KGD58_01590 [Candidatus Lokiarchaeota archaeon]|nr:hypothetical protein [Candidatus Lokiarchaeota archaeon]
MSKNIEDDYSELIKLGEKAGISELMEIYGQSEEISKITEEYLKEYNTKFFLTTTNSTK